jgi:hypothetical protein
MGSRLATLSFLEDGSDSVSVRFAGTPPTIKLHRWSSIRFDWNLEMKSKNSSSS